MSHCKSLTGAKAQRILQAMKNTNKKIFAFKPAKPLVHHKHLIKEKPDS